MKEREMRRLRNKQIIAEKHQKRKEEESKRKKDEQVHGFELVLASIGSKRSKIKTT